MGIEKESFIEKYWAHFIIIIAGFNLLYRFIDESQLIHTFPFDFTNDISAYMGQLHFLKVCGFHQFCHYWYNGFINLVMSPPGWYFFAYPLYVLLGSVTAATYVSMIILFILAFIAVFYLGKQMHLTRIKRVVFYMLFFANASVIGNVIRNGRQHAMLNLVLLVILFAIMWSYKDRKLNTLFFISSVVYSLMLITHYQETVLAGLFFLCLFVYKRSIKERLMIIASVILSFIFASWWILDFVKNLAASSLLAFHEGERVFLFNKEVILTNIMTIIIPLALLVVFYVYWKRKQENRREILFFLPIIGLDVLYLFRVTTVIPILRNISQDPYLMFFLFFILFIFFKEERMFMTQRKLRILITFGLMLIVILSVMINMLYTPLFVQNTPIDKEVISLFSKVDDRFLLFGPFEIKDGKPPYSKAVYTYAAIYYNLSTPDGWSPPLASLEYQLRLDAFYKRFGEKNCDYIKSELKFFNTTNAIGASPLKCEILRKCGFKEIRSEEDVCLYKLED